MAARSRRAPGSPGPPIGAIADIDYEQGELPFENGSRIVLYSDGLVEEKNAEGELFGNERVLELLGGVSNSTEDVDVLVRALSEYSNIDKLTDDLTIASVEVFDSKS